MISMSGLLIVAAVTALGPWQGPAAVASPALATSTQAAITSALAQAAASGNQTEVTSARTFYSQLFADPNGQLMKSMSTEPIFGRDATGALVPVDTTLDQDASGIRPAATALSTVFPLGGGKTIALEGDGVDLSLSLPTTLPTPRVDGSTATYPDVYPGVDLQLTATADGMRQVFVVKDASAATDPQLAQLSFGLSSKTGTLVPSTGGSVSVLRSGGAPVMTTGVPVMWDSGSETAPVPSTSGTATATPNGSQVPSPTSTPSTGPSSGPSAATPRATSGPATANADPADAAEPAEGDKVIPVDTKVKGHQMSLAPSSQFLDGAKTVYPVYIDPAPSLTQNGRLRVGSSVIGAQWQFSTDGGVGRCPYEYDSNCRADHVERLFYQYGRSGLNSGDDIVKAEFRADEDWSANCTARNVTLEQTGTINSSTRWPGPKVTRSIQTVSAAHGYSASCPENKVEFSNSTLTSAAQSLANGSISQLTLGLRASDETNELAWKRFKAAAVLQVWYVSKPGIPTHWGYKGTGTSGVQCSTDSTDPTVADSYDPKFLATVRTAVKPTSPVELKARFQVQGKPTGGSYADVWSPGTRDNAQWVDENTNIAYTPPATDALPKSDDHFRMRVKGLSHYEDFSDIPDGTIQSAWSSWCYFDVDPDGPVAPVLDAVGTNDVAMACEKAISTGDVCDDPDGEPLTFRFSVDPSDNDPNLDHFKATVSPAVLATITETSGMGAQATVTPSVPGHFKLNVVLWDSNLRHSSTSWVEIAYDPPASLSEWDVTSADTASAITNSGVTGAGGGLALAGDATLTAPDGGRSGNIRDDAGNLTDEAIAFHGSGEATSASAPTDTSLSFTIGAWAMLTSGDTDQTVFSQVSSDGATGIEVRYVASTNSWVAQWHYVSSGTPHSVTTGASGPAMLNAWTSLIVSYDAAANTLTLYVNGTASPPRSLTGAAAPTTVSAPLVLGHAGPAGTSSPTAGFNGRIDQIQVWNRAMGTVEAYGNAIHPYISNDAYLSRVADWNAAYSTTSSVPDVSSFARPGLALTGGASVDTTSDAPVVTLDGSSGGLEVQGPVVDGTSAFTVNVDMAPNIASMTGADTSYRIAGQQGASGGPDSSWALWFERTAVNTDGTVQGYFKLGSWSAPSTGSVAGGASADDLVTLDGSEFNVTGVYRPADSTEPDPSAMQLAVYVNLQGTDGATEVGETAFSGPAQGTGAFALGTGWKAGAWSDWLPADISEVTVFAGGASADQIPNLPDWSEGSIQ